MTPQTGLGNLPLVGILVVVWIVLAVLLYWWFRPAPRVLLLLAVAGPVGIAAFAGLVTHFSKQSATELSMQRDGLRGVATILRAESTNVLVNKRPQVNLQLRIELPGRAAYEHSLVELVPFGQSATPGRKLRVYVDSKEHTKLMLDWASAPPDQGGTEVPASGASSLADRLSELEDARKKGLITEAEYRQQRERLLSKF